MALETLDQILARQGSIPDRLQQEDAKRRFEAGDVNAQFTDPRYGTIKYEWVQNQNSQDAIKRGLPGDWAFNIFKTPRQFEADIPFGDTPQTETPEQKAIRTGQSALDVQFEGAVQDKAKQFAGGKSLPTEEERQTAANLPVRAGINQPELEEALKLRTNNLGIPVSETALADTIDFPSELIDTEDISKDTTDLTGLFDERKTGKDLNNALGLGLGSMDSAIMGLFQQQQKAAEAQRVALEERQSGLETGFTDLLGTSSQDKLEKTLEANQVQEKMDSLNDIRERMLKKTEALNLGIQAEDQRVAPLTVIGRRQQIIRDQAANELSALNVAAQVIQGDLGFAMNMAELSFNALQSDRTEQLNAYQFMLGMNKNDLINLKADEKDAINNQIITIQNAMASAEANKDRMANLITKNENYAQAAVKAGVGLTDDFNESLVKMLPFLEVEGATGNWVSFVDSDGEVQLLNKDTGNTKPSTVASADSETYFTDASGINWNIEGWATDPTKVAQMQSISDRIGKLTDENLEAKVMEFASGITADMIRNTSAKTGVSWEALLTMVNQESLGGTSNVAVNNNNYGGLTFNDQDWIKEFGGTKGTARPEAEGGNYIGFPDPQSGLDAMGALMANYGTVTPALPTDDADVQNYLKLVNSGQITPSKAIDEIDEKKKSALIEALSTAVSPEDTIEQEKAKEKLLLMDNILKSPGMGESVGATWIQRVDWWKYSGAKENFIGAVEQLVAQDTLDALLNLKKAGGTLGALSNEERIMLKNAATRIGNWGIDKDGDGKVDFYDIDEKSFETEVNEMKRLTQKAIGNSIAPEIQTTPDGVQWQKNPDGSMTKLN